MSNLGFELNDGNAPEQQDFTPIPAGWYQVTIEKAEAKPTKDGTGAYINLQCKVLGPSYANRVIFGMINYKSKSDQAEVIGKRLLDSLRRAMKIDRLVDTDQFVGGTVEAKIGIQISKDPQYEDKNDIKQFREITGGMPVQTKKAETKPAGSGAPWDKAKKVENIFSDEDIPM